MTLTDEQRKYAAALAEALLTSSDQPLFFLKPEERHAVITALAAGTPTITPEIFERALTWADSVRRDQGILDNILKGQIRIHGKPNSLMFSLNEDGMRSAEELIADMHAKHVAKGDGG